VNIPHNAVLVTVANHINKLQQDITAQFPPP